MKCPIDGETLVMAERNRVEIDYCPKCRGVWLDRGELDKIIELSAPPPRVQAVPASPHKEMRRPQSKKKKESFLSELFDF